MLTTFQKIKETILITILNVLLPSVDIFTDLGSVIKLYIGIRTHPDCDEWSNELSAYGDIWTVAKENCIENSSAEGIIYTSQAGWATALFVPFLVNYVTTWVVWWSVDKKKTSSWVAPLLSVYPQVRTLRCSTYDGITLIFPDVCSKGFVPHLDKP